MDGNRRWAKGQGLPATDGHKKGLEKASEVILWAREKGISELTLYAFSTENWNRSPEEVRFLMDLFVYAFEHQFNPFINEGGRIRFIGDRSRVSSQLRSLMEGAEQRSERGTNGTLVIALSYGGRAEILAAVQTLLAEKRETVTEEAFREAMWSAGLLDPDLIIRTGGDHRLSNFLTWQSVYSELFFTETTWPAFTKDEFESILTQFAGRERRLGK